MAAMDLPPSESESGSDAEAPGTSHNPNRPSRRAAPGPWGRPAWAWRRWSVLGSLQMSICGLSFDVYRLFSAKRASGKHQGLLFSHAKIGVADALIYCYQRDSAPMQG